MRKFKKNPEAFSFHDIRELKKKISELGINLPLEEDLENNLFRLQESLLLEGKKVPNAFCVQPMEGCDGKPDGNPGELTLRRYKRFVSGGAGMIWVEATAVTPEARANPRQLWINENSLSGFRDLVEIIRENSRNYKGERQNPYVVLQLTHSGRYSKPEGKPRPIIFHHSPFLDPTYHLKEDYPLISDKELDTLKNKYLIAAQIAFACGFDAVDIKACHGYLIDEILSSHTCKESKYGGSFVNRIRFFVEIIEKIKKSLPRLAVTTRLNVYDGIPYPYGWGMKKDGSLEPDLDEPIKLIDEMKKMGITLVNICTGNPYYNPHIERPYDYPVAGASFPEEHPLKSIAKTIKLISQIAKVHPDVLLVTTGISWLRELFPYLGIALIRKKWSRIIGLGRLSLANPNFVNELFSTGKLKPENQCLSCSSCTQIMHDGGKSGCVIRDAEIYGPIYREGRLKDKDYLKESGEKCGECWAAACKGACPAGMDIPGFINAFIRGKIREAYRTIRKTNILAETCAYVCPVEVLCEKNCTRGILDNESVPIKEIQKYIARSARENGWTKVIPGKSKGKKVAIIGFGPAGISSAVSLIERGYGVCVFEANALPGGALNLIPSARLPASVFREEIFALKLEESGLFEMRRKRICENFSLDDIFKKDFSAVFIAAGLSEGISLFSQKPKGVYQSLDFLKKMKRERISLPSRVAVIGGGNVAMDAAISAKEKGVKDIYLIYRRSFSEMPAWPEEIEKALKIGVHFYILHQPTGYITDENGRLKGIKLARTELGEEDASKRRRPFVIPGSEYIFPVTLCIEATGQTVSPDLRNGLKEVKFENGLIKIVKGKCGTNRDGVFAGGDIVNGGKTVVAAVSDGMQAAKEIDDYLK